MFFHSIQESIILIACALFGACMANIAALWTDRQSRMDDTGRNA